MKWRWLAVVGVSFMLSACAETFPVCPSVGGVANASCYYYLTITKVNNGSGEVMGKVAQSVVEADHARYGYKDYDAKAYNFFEYLFHIEPSNLNLEKDKSYMFVNVPNESLFKLCTTSECNNASKEFDSQK